MRFFAIFLAISLAVSAIVAGETPRPPTAADLPDLASSLAERLRGLEVATPDGGTIDVGADLLDESRLEIALATIGEAEAWPTSWLVVQDLSVSYDLILRIALAPDGAIATPDVVFAAERREWDDAAFDAAWRAARGGKPPRERSRNVVVQTFSKRTVTQFVWEVPKTGKEAKGLLSLLPEGSFLREATSVDLGDGNRHTLALVLDRPAFVPSACGDEPGVPIDHADSGAVSLYLAGETAIEGRLDLSEDFQVEDGRILVPHWGCRPGDDDPDQREMSPAARFSGREPLRVLTTGVLDGQKVEVRVLPPVQDPGGDRRPRLVALAMIHEGKPGLFRGYTKTIILAPDP